jgi:hypothetical protein
MRANATDPVQLVAKRSSELRQLSAVLKCRASSPLLTPNILTATSRGSASCSMFRCPRHAWIRRVMPALASAKLRA